MADKETKCLKLGTKIKFKKYIHSTWWWGYISLGQFFHSPRNNDQEMKLGWLYKKMSLK